MEREEGGRWEVGRDKRMTGEAEEWQKGMKRRAREKRRVGGLRWVVRLVRFVLLCQPSQASVHPAETKRDESVRIALRLLRGKVKRAPAGMARSKAGRGLELVKIAWAELQAESLMPHLLFIGSGGLSSAACQRSTYNQTSSIIGTPRCYSGIHWSGLVQWRPIYMSSVSENNFSDSNRYSWWTVLW